MGKHLKTPPDTNSARKNLTSVHAGSGQAMPTSLMNDIKCSARFLGRAEFGEGLAKCRSLMQWLLLPLSPSWRRHERFAHQTSAWTPAKWAPVFQR